jgi:hypothetical protein
VIAALYVQTGGAYCGLEGVDPWDEARDARTYAGPYPVVAHPPCAAWGRFAYRTAGGPGEDSGCFEAALASVRQWGGVLEHPKESAAWERFGLLRPWMVGWCRSRVRPNEWTCGVHQRNYGHRALKATWLLYVGEVPPPPLDWSMPEEPEAFVTNSARTRRERAEGVCTPIMSKRERSATPPAFRDLLIGLARDARGGLVSP